MKGEKLRRDNKENEQTIWRGKKENPFLFDPEKPKDRIICGPRCSRPRGPTWGQKDWKDNVWKSCRSFSFSLTHVSTRMSILHVCFICTLTLAFTNYHGWTFNSPIALSLPLGCRGHSFCCTWTFCTLLCCFSRFFIFPPPLFHMSRKWK